MKKLPCIILLSFIFQFANAQSDTRIGGMLAYGTEVENLGIGVNAEFPIIENLTVSPSFIYYLPKKETGVNINWFEINGNGNYYFLDEGSIQAYGLAGLNYSSIGVDYDGAYTGFLSASSRGRVGLNLGGGANFQIGGSILPFAELKYVIIDEGQLVIAAGIKFNL